MSISWYLLVRLLTLLLNFGARRICLTPDPKTVNSQGSFELPEKKGN